jgi:hypothetical protein
MPVLDPFASVNIVLTQVDAALCGALTSVCAHAWRREAYHLLLSGAPGAFVALAG